MYRYKQKIPIEYASDEYDLVFCWFIDCHDEDIDVFPEIQYPGDVGTTTICYPLKFNGVEYYDYGVCKRSGFIYSSKSGDWNILRPNISGKNVYPKVSIEGKTIAVHIAVMETLNPLPKPRGVSESEWLQTPDSVKNFCRAAWFVNHKDHDKANFLPNNLEWCTAKENARAYQKFKRKQKNVY